MSAYGEDEGTVLDIEEEIIEELKDAVGKVEKISEKEEVFLNSMSEGKHPNKIQNNIADLEIFLDKDIQPELEDVETKVQSLRDIVSGNDTPHRDILEHISNALGMMEKEEQRFRRILEKAERNLENAEGTEDVQKIEKKIVEFEENEERNVMENIENEIANAEGIYEDYLRSAIQ